MISEEQVGGMVEAMRDASLTRRCQEKAPKGLLFRTDEEKASVARQAARSLADEDAVIMLVMMLLQSTVVTSRSRIQALLQGRAEEAGTRAG